MIPTVLSRIIKCAIVPLVCVLMGACAMPKSILFDAEIGSSTDDLFALQMLHRYQDKGKCRVIGVVVDRMGDSCAMLADIMDTYYRHPNIPLALERNGILDADEFIPCKSILNDTLPDGTWLFPRTCVDYGSLPDGYQLYRQMLAKADDHSVSIVATGFVNSIVHLLQSEPDSLSPLNGVDLVRHKVNALYMMATKLGENDRLGYNLTYDTLAAQLLFQLWPSEVPIRISPSMAGDAIQYDSAQVVADMMPLAPNPILQTYLTDPINHGQRMWDALPVINAVEGDCRFRLSPRGTVRIDENGKVLFTPQPEGNCRYHLLGSQRANDRILRTIRQSVMGR